MDDLLSGRFRALFMPQVLAEDNEKRGRFYFFKGFSEMGNWDCEKIEPSPFFLSHFYGIS
jgi:hypothetical protein